MRQLGEDSMDSIKFGCNDLLDGIEFKDDTQLLNINCVSVESTDGCNRIYAYYNFLGTRLCELDEKNQTPYVAASIFPYDIQSTIDDEKLDQMFGKGSWHKGIANVRCRIPVSFDMDSMDSGNARTVQTVISDAKLLCEPNQIRVAMDTIVSTAGGLISRLVGDDDSKVILNRFKNLWYEVSTWIPIDSLTDNERVCYLKMLNAARAVYLAEPYSVNDLSMYIPKTNTDDKPVFDWIKSISVKKQHDANGFNIKICIGNGHKSGFDGCGLIKLILSITPFIEAGASVSTFDWSPAPTDYGYICSRIDAYRLAHFAALPECDGGYQLAEFIARSVIRSKWGREIIANDEKFAYAAASMLGTDELRIIRDAIGSYRFDKLAGDLARYTLGIGGSGIEDDWEGITLSDVSYQPIESSMDYVVQADDDHGYSDDDDFYDHDDDYDSYEQDWQADEYESVFRDILPLVTEQARDELFSKLPGLERFADAKSGEPIEKEDDETIDSE